MAEEHRTGLTCVDAEHCPFAEVIKGFVASMADLTRTVAPLAALPSVMESFRAEVRELRDKLSSLVAAQIQKEKDAAEASSTLKWILGVIVSMVMLGASFVAGHMFGAK